MLIKFRTKSLPVHRRGQEKTARQHGGFFFPEPRRERHSTQNSAIVCCAAFVRGRQRRKRPAPFAENGSAMTAICGRAFSSADTAGKRAGADPGRPLSSLRSLRAEWRNTKRNRVYSVLGIGMTIIKRNTAGTRDGQDRFGRTVSAPVFRPGRFSEPLGTGDSEKSWNYAER